MAASVSGSLREPRALAGAPQALAGHCPDRPGLHEPARLERVYKLFFLCRLDGGEAATSLETDAVDFLPLNALPPLSIGRTLAADIEMLAAARARPEQPCYFD